MQACFRVEPNYALNKFYLTISTGIRSILDGEQKYSDICKSELVYNLQLLRSCFAFRDGTVLLQHQQDIVQLVEQIFQLDYEDSEDFRHAKRLLGELMYTNTFVHLVIKPTVNKRQDWPSVVDLKDMVLNWTVPSAQTIDFARTLLRTFVKPEMERLQAWTTSRHELSKSQLEKSLSILDTFYMYQECFPAFVSKPKQPKTAYLSENFFAILELFDGEPMRDQLLLLMHRVLERLRTAMPDSVSLFTTVISVSANFCIVTMIVALELANHLFI